MLLNENQTFVKELFSFVVGEKGGDTDDKVYSNTFKLMKYPYLNEKVVKLNFSNNTSKTFSYSSYLLRQQKKIIHQKMVFPHLLALTINLPPVDTLTTYPPSPKNW